SGEPEVRGSIWHCTRAGPARSAAAAVSAAAKPPPKLRLVWALGRQGPRAQHVARRLCVFSTVFDWFSERAIEGFTTGGSFGKCPGHDGVPVAEVFRP